MHSDADWRRLSIEISPEVQAGFDVEGLTGLSKKQLKLIALPKTFGLHKSHDSLQVVTTACALALYGELDRAVAGLLPLQQIPIWEYKVAHFANLALTINGVYFFTEHALRADLQRSLTLVRNFPPVYAPKPVAFSAERLRSHLDIPEDELAGMSHITTAMWIERYVRSAGRLGELITFGGSEEYPPARLEQEIRRYAAAIFSTPGYEPFTDHPYSV